MDFECGWLNMSIEGIRKTCIGATPPNIRIMRGAAVAETLALSNSDDATVKELYHVHPLELENMQSHALDVVRFCDNWLSLPF